MLRHVASSRAGDTSFDFRVDRFEILRTSEFPRGIDGFEDEFDALSDAAGEGWTLQYGTAFAADGFVHLTSPGTELPGGFGVLPGKTLDLSLIASQRQVADGEGGFIARSYWEPDALAPGDFNHMSLNTIALGMVREVAGLAITNATPAGEPTVYTFVQHLVRFGSGGPAVETAGVAVDPSTITGQIVFELRFDDATDALTTAFSIDGGETFQRPFPPLRIFDGASYGIFLLGADPQAGTVRSQLPPAPFCAHETLVGDGGIATAARKGGGLVVDGNIETPARPLQGHDPRREGVQIRIVDRTRSGQPVLDLTGAAAVPGGPGCAVRDGWRRVPGGFVYRNASGALPPSCTPGSAGGVTRIRLRRTARPFRAGGRTTVRPGLRYELDLADPWAPAGGARIATTLALGDGSGAAGSCATLEVHCSATAAGVRCR